MIESEPRALAPLVPCPGVPEPEAREHVEGSGLGAAILHGDADQDVLRRGLGVLDRHVEVPSRFEGARLEKLELAVPSAAAAILLDEPGIGILGMRVLVEPLEVRVRGGGVEIEVVLLDVLAVIALGTRETEVALLQDAVAPIPQGEPEAKALMIVGDAEDAILTPAIRARARVVMREVVPGRAV